MSNKGDYGYFGTGASGYAHYMQAFNSTTKSGGHSSTKASQKSNDDDNPLIWILLLPFLPLYFIGMFVKFLLE